MQILGIGSQIQHPDYGKGVIIDVLDSSYEVTFIDDGIRRVALDGDYEVQDAATLDTDRVSMRAVQKSLKKILEEWLDSSEIVELGDRWTGGTMTLTPGREGLASKEIPIETFFHKIVMLRDRLRVLEQKVNSSELPDQTKVDIQQYISRCYGSLTTFNILFKNSDQQFSTK